jgi:hypothetical protein
MSMKRRERRCCPSFRLAARPWRQRGELRIIASRAVRRSTSAENSGEIDLTGVPDRQHPQRVL